MDGLHDFDTDTAFNEREAARQERQRLEGFQFFDRLDALRHYGEADNLMTAEQARIEGAKLVGILTVGQEQTPTQVHTSLDGKNPDKDAKRLISFFGGDASAIRGADELELENAALEAGRKAYDAIDVAGMDEAAAGAARKRAATLAANAEYLKYAEAHKEFEDKVGDAARGAYLNGMAQPFSDADLFYLQSPLTPEERAANDYLRKVAEEYKGREVQLDALGLPIGRNAPPPLDEAAKAADELLKGRRDEIRAARAAAAVRAGWARRSAVLYAASIEHELGDGNPEVRAQAWNFAKWVLQHPDVNPSRMTQLDYRLQKDREKGAGENDFTLSKGLMLALDNPDASPESQRYANEWYMLDQFTSLPDRDRERLAPLMGMVRGYRDGADTVAGAAYYRFMDTISNTMAGTVEGLESFVRRSMVNAEDYQRQAEIWADVRNATEEKSRSFRKDWGGFGGWAADAVVGAVGNLPYGFIAGAGYGAGALAIAIDERQKMEDIVASQGGDVSSPEFIWQSSLMAAIHSGVEYIAWNQLAGFFKGEGASRNFAVRVFERLSAREGFTSTIAFIGTETAEEVIQDTLEQVFTDLKLDKPPEEVIGNMARTIYSTARDTVGSMAVTGIVGAGKRAITTNTRTAHRLSEDDMQRAMQARREVARMMEEREDRTMDASAVNMDEYERNLGDITLGYLESGGRRGNGLRFLTGLGFNETDAKAMAHTIDTLWRSVNTSLEGDARDEAIRKALGGREQLSPEERIRARIPAAREVKPVKEDGKVVAYDVVMDLKDKDGNPITVKDKDGRDVPWTIRITESKAAPIDWDNEEALHSLFAALRSDPNTREEWADKTINDLKLHYTAEQRAALNASLSNPLLARGYTAPDADNPNVDNMVLGLGYEDFAIAHESLHSFLDALEAAGEITPEERKTVGEAVNANADEEDLADVYEILMSRINPQDVAKRGRIENFLNKLNAWQEGKGSVLDAFRAERKREIDLGNDFFNQIANGNWRGVTWAKRQAPDAEPQRTAEELEEDRLARVEEEDSWNATAEPVPAADEGEVQPSNPEQSVQAQRARDAAQRERENPARREEAERVAAAVAEIDRLLNSFGDDGVADFLSDRRHASAWDALGAARDAGDGNAIGVAAQRLLVMARAYDAARRRKAEEQSAEREAIEEAKQERGADAEARAKKIQERKGREEENRRRNEKRAAVNRWLAKQEEKDRRKIMGDERRKMREERRRRIAALAEEVIDATQDGGMAIETAIDAVAETDYERKRLLDIFAEQIRARDAEREEDARARREEEDSYNYNGEALPVDEEGAVAGGDVETWGVTLPDGTAIGGEVTATDLDGLVLPEGATNPLTNEEMRDLAMALVEAGPDAIRLNVDYNGVVQSPPWMLDVVRLVYDLGYGDRMREAAARGNWNLGGMTRPVVVERVAGGTDEETKAKVRSAYIDAAMAEIEARRQEREREKEAAAKAAAEAAQQQEQAKQEQEAQPKPSVTAKRMDFSYKADDYEKYTGDATGAAFLTLRNERGAIIPLPAGFADYWREYTKWRKAVNNGWQYHGQKAGPENRPRMQAFGVADTALADWCAAFLDGRTFDDAEVRFLFGRGALGARAVRGGGDSGNYLAELASLAPGLAGEVVENGDGTYDVDSFLDAALDAYRKYAEWRQGKSTARKEGRETLTAEERHWQEAEEEEEADRRDAIRAWDDAIRRGEAIDMDDIGAAIAQEYDNAVGFVYDEGSEDWRPFDGENLSRLRDGDWVQWDGETEAFRFAGYDAGNGVLTITSEDTGRTRTFEVTDDAILETTEENDNDRGQTETRPDDDLAGNEAGEGGARKEGGGAEGDFALESATPEQIESERERARVRAEIERRLNERIEGGVVNIQENFDLGDGGSGDLFEPTTRYSLVRDRDLKERLENGPTVKVYRAMQLVDGKLYPPMAGKVDGKWQDPVEFGQWIVADERPDLVKDGKFTLNKGNGKSIPAAYNPYWHTSRSPLNDQFSSAWVRPNLVTVECEVPESELASGYKAEGAKDAVGEMSWHTGPVSSRLAKIGKPRLVILSRYVKVNRVVPDAEVADKVAEMLDGTGISIPENTVTPSLRAELERRGVAISPPKGLRYSLARRGDDSLSPRSYGANTYLTAMIATDILRGIDRSDTEYERLAANLHAKLPVADARDRAAQAIARDGRRAVREAVPREQMKHLAKGVEAAEMKNHLMDAATGGQRAGVDYGQIAERGAQRAKTNIRRDGAAQSSDYAEFLEHFGVDIAGMLTGRELDGPPADYPQAQKVQLFPVNVALDATTDERARALLAAFKAWRENQDVWLRDAMEKAGGEYLGQAFPIPPELMEKAGLDLNSSGDLAAFLKVAVCAWIAESEGVNASVERILSNPLYARRYAVTMARLLRDLAQKVMDPKNAFAARQVERAIASLEADEVTPESVEKRTAAVIRTVNVNAVRQTRKAIIKDLRDQIHALAGVWEDSKIDELERDENRRVLGHVARMAKFVSEAIGYGAVRTAKEIAKAQKRMEEAAKAVDLSGRTDITAADLESYRRAAQELVALEQYGGLNDKAPAEIQREGLRIVEWLKNAYAEHEARWDAYTRENDAIQKPFAAGADNAVRRIEALEDFAELNLSSISDRLMLICRGAKGDKAEAAQRAIDEINYIINRAVQKRDAVKVKYENDLAAAIYDAVDGTGMSARDFVRHLGEKVDDDISRAITDMGDPAKGRRGQRHFNDGARDSRLTWGQVLYILSYLEQTQSYGRNIKLYGRENQAAYIRSVASSADLKFLRNLQGLMASHRGELSDSLMEITGFSISAPDVFYFPVHTYNGPGEGLDTEISGAFNPLAPYTPRRMHSKDIDESRDILSVYMESALNDAGIIAFGLDGMRLRSILTRKETMEAIYAGVGKYEAEKMRSQLTDIITDGRAIRPTAVDRMMQRLNSFATYTQLGFNLNSSLKQLASIPAWAGVLPDGGRNVVRYIMDFDWAAARELMDGDGFAARYGRYGWGRGMVAKVLSDPRLSWWGKAKQLSMTPIQFCDFVPGIMVATGLYKAQYEALRDRGLSPAEAKARAQVYAWQKIEESQQSSQQQNMNEVFRRAGVFGRAALKYANAPVLQASHVFTTARLALADPKNARKWGNFAATVAANHILMPCAMYAITSGFRAMLGQEPPEEWRAELITMMILGSFGRIIMVGGILETGLRAIAGLPQKTGGDIPGFDNARRVEADVLGAMGVTNQFDVEKMGEAWSDLAKDLSPLLRHILTAVENWGE